LNEEIVIKTLRTSLEKLFPKKCTNCCKQFATIKEFLLNTSHVGEPIFYDLRYGDRVHCPPFGIVRMFNCVCGTTLSLRIHELSVATFIQLQGWIDRESKRQGVSTDQIMAQIRVKIDDMVLGTG